MDIGAFVGKFDGKPRQITIAIPVKK
jgi:hypothetical protein